MSEEPIQRPPSGPESENNAWKWIAGGVAAVALIAGGVYAVSNNHNQPAETQTAYSADAPNDPFADLSDEPSKTTAPDADVAAESTTTTEPAPRRRTARAEPIEATIGVTPASVTTSNTTDTEEIVVPAPRRAVWARVPSERRLTALYPARALERGREGEASLRCTVLNDGDLDCARVAETPANSGFGAAALRVARTLQHAPQRADGTAAAGSAVNLRVLFRLEDEPRRRRG